MRISSIGALLSAAALGGMVLVGAARAQDNPPAADATQAAPAQAAPAQAAKPAVKAKARMKRKLTKAGHVVSVVVVNKREVGLVELQAAESGGEPKKIAGPLPPGKKARATLTYKKACAFDLHAEFEDGQTTDAADFDACKDRTINLVD